MLLLETHFKSSQKYNNILNLFVQGKHSEVMNFANCCFKDFQNKYLHSHEQFIELTTFSEMICIYTADKITIRSLLCLESR